MKTVTIRTLITLSMAFFMLVPMMSQTGAEDGSKYGQGQDSINCLMNLSLYREFFKHNNYNDAIGPWRQAFDECPASSEGMYVDGVKMYKKFLSGQKNPELANALVDTIMLIYDRRMEYFNDAANVLSRKAIDLLRYRKDDLESIEEAYGYLKESINLKPEDASDAAIILYINTSVSLNKAGAIPIEDAINDYFSASNIIDAELAKNPNNRRFQRAKSSVDEFMLEANILDCNSLNEYYEPIFEENKADEDFLNKMIDFYYSSACDRSDMYVKASEQLYKIDPSAESAYKLARLLVAKEEYERASGYYKEAVAADVDAETKAQYYYELAAVTRVLGKTCESIEYAREAVSNDPNYGEAYLLLGDLYIESRSNLGDDFEKRTAFWAAADKYIKAKNVDAGLSGDANKRINDYAAQYPDGEACFFRTLKEGDSYLVKGCINEYTTVRPRK